MWEGIMEYSCCKEERERQLGKDKGVMIHGTYLRVVMTLEWPERCIHGGVTFSKNGTREIDSQMKA